MRIIICVCMLFVGMSTTALTAEVKIAASEYAPYNYLADGEVTGVSAEVAKRVLASTGTEARLRLYPWPRAYKMARREENVLIFPIARTAEREEQFQWIGTVAPAKTYLYKLKERTDITLESLEEAKSYTIGCVRDDFTLAYLSGKGFSDIIVNYLEEMNIRMLANNRLDLIPFTEAAFLYRLREMGLDERKYEKALFLEDISRDFYMAFSKNTSKELVTRYQQALSRLHESGEYQRIVKEFFGKSSN